MQEASSQATPMMPSDARKGGTVGADMDKLDRLIRKEYTGDRYVTYTYNAEG